MRLIVGASALALLLFWATPALAHEGEEEDVTAHDLVRQAIAYLQLQPDMHEMIEDRMADALEDDETEGVDLSLVEDAQSAFEAGRMNETIDLLAESIDEPVGPGLHRAEVGGGLRAPGGTAGPVLLVLAALLVASGAWIAVRER